MAHVTLASVMLLRDKALAVVEQFLLLKTSEDWVQSTKYICRCTVVPNKRELVGLDGSVLCELCTQSIKGCFDSTTEAVNALFCIANSKQLETTFLVQPCDGLDLRIIGVLELVNEQILELLILDVNINTVIQDPSQFTNDIANSDGVLFHLQLVVSTIEFTKGCAQSLVQCFGFRIKGLAPIEAFDFFVCQTDIF